MPYDWTDTLRWLMAQREALSQTKGTPEIPWQEMPLPAGFPCTSQELKSYPWVCRKDGRFGVEVYLGDTGYSVVLPCRGDPFVVCPDGTVIELEAEGSQPPAAGK